MENFPFNITVMPRKKTWINNSKIHIFTGALFVKKGTTPKMVLINVEKNVGITSRLTLRPKRRCRSANYHKLLDPGWKTGQFEAVFCLYTENRR